ncbi:MAG: glycosyltransferase family 32 protein, partial [Janthinobacterium lividum]
SSQLFADVARSTVIPRIIHQTYAKRELPDALQNNVTDLKEQNPGWEHRLYDDAAIENFILNAYGQEVLSAYLRIDPLYGAARADLFRYLVVYKLGGVYLDIKSRFLRPIDQVIQGDEEFIVSQWSNRPGAKYEGFGLKPEVEHISGGELQQWHVIGAPGHPFLRAVLLAIFDGIDKYRPWLHRTGKVGVMRLTGPLIYTLTIVPLIDQYPCRVIANESVIGLDYSITPGDTHKKFFTTHYSTSEVSVVQFSGFLGIISSIYQAARALKRQLRRS